MTAVFEVAERESAGKGAARAVRRTGFVPGVIYGDKKAPQLLSMEHRQATKLLHFPGIFSTVIDLKMGDETHSVLCRDIQLDPIKDMPVHVDFMRVTEDTTLVVSVKLTFINQDQSPGLRRGGLLNIVNDSLDVRCAVRDLPDSLKVDMAGLGLNATMAVKNIELPEGVEILARETDVVATVAVPANLRAKLVQEAAGN